MQSGTGNKGVPIRMANHYENLAKAGRVNKFEADQVIFHEGEHGQEMYIILSGQVDISINTVEGYPLSIARLENGNFFGEMSLLEGLPRSATATTLKDTTVLVITKDNFQNVINDNPIFAVRMMQTLSARIRRLDEQLARIKTLERQKTLLEEEKDQAPTISNTAKISFADEDDLFPLRHAEIVQSAPAVHEKYLFDKGVSCPICKRQLTMKVQRSSRMRLNRVEQDFRQVFYEFEPLWYWVTVCPHCLYANFSSDFNQVGDKEAILIGERINLVKNKEKARLSEPRKLEEVFAAYYLVYKVFTAIATEPDKMAKVWLRLSWLYQDVGNMNMFLSASKEALYYYLLLYNDRRRNFSDSQIQRLDMLIAELLNRTDQKEQALKHYQRAISVAPDKTLANQARDRIREIKRA